VTETQVIGMWIAIGSQVVEPYECASILICQRYYSGL
jgi:hypothetical protein